MSLKEIRVGNRVRFLNDVGGGKVVGIIDRATLLVENEDGFEVPVLKSEVILIDNAGDTTLEELVQEDRDRPGSKQSPPNTNSIANTSSLAETEADDPEAYLDEIDFATADPDPDQKGDTVGLHVAFVPVNQTNIVDSDHHFYIINDSTYRVFYSIGYWSNDLVIPLRAGFLYPDTKEQIHTFKRELLNQDLVLSIQAQFFKNTQFVAQQPEYTDLEVNPRKFFKPGSFTSNDFFEEKALLLSIADTKREALVRSLTEDAIAEAIRQKEQAKKPPSKEPTNQQAVEEVDLHIHELVENPTLLTPAEIIDIQLSRFKFALESAIKGKTRRIVFIHGVGNGKLKHEVRKALEKDYPKLRYQDASFKEYGYGATMVILK